MPAKKRSSKKRGTSDGNDKTSQPVIRADTGKRPSTKDNSKRTKSSKRNTPDSRQADTPEAPTASPQTARFPIVGIGASAGGLEALQEFFSTMPANTGMAFIVVTHLHRGQPSMLPELLARQTAMPVSEVEHGERVEPNHVYVGTPGGPFGISGGVLQQFDEDGADSPKLLVDRLFRALAEDRHELAICVVLSGTGSDGTLGVRAVKAESGMAMVQNPESAKYAGMPSSAIATGLVDYVLPVGQMAKQLVSYVEGPYLKPRARETAETAMPQEDLQKILVQLRNRTGHDFTAYKLNTVRRRIERRMNVHQLEDPADYVRYLRDNPHEVDRLFSELLISVTSFFRDPAAFDALCTAMRNLVQSRPDDHKLRAWVPGCATGEEAYSVAIVLYECMEQSDMRLDIQVFGTDLDRQAIEVARRGAYADGIKADVSPERLARWFASEDNTYRVRKELREMLVFAPQDVAKDPPFTKLDLVACRNVLIYMENELQKLLLPIFHYTLRPEGLLFLGPSESLGELGNYFETIDSKWKIFRRKETPSLIHAVLPGGRALAKVDAGDSGSQEVLRPKPAGTASQISTYLLNRFAPACVVVNEAGDIVFIHGRTGQFLEPTQGQPRHNIVDMARQGLSTALASALRQAVAARADVVRDRVQVKTNGESMQVRVTATRIDAPESLRGLILVSIQPTETPQSEASTDVADTSDRLPDRTDDLEWELHHTKETLQSTVEELETSNEELKSAIEEHQSTNEELQSTNEEIETSKEELQSLNEELTTVNSELNSKVEDLSRANDDMHNLLNSTQIATIFLDTHLKVKRYTDQAKGFVRLIRSDVGRPLSDLATNLRYNGLVSDCEEVLQTLATKSMEVQTTDGTWQLLRIMPYRTTQDVIDGVVLTLVDISRIKEVEERSRSMESSRDFFESIVQTVREPLLVLDEEHRVVSANAPFVSTFDKQGMKLHGRTVYELGNGQWNIPELHRLLEDILPENQAFEGYRVERDFPRVGRKAFILNARRLIRDETLPCMILLAFEEVSPKGTP